MRITYFKGSLRIRRDDYPGKCLVCVSERAALLTTLSSSFARVRERERVSS